MDDAWKLDFTRVASERLPLQTRVTLAELHGKPELNGRAGNIVRLCSEGRYGVRLIGGKARGGELVKPIAVRAVNLRVRHITRCVVFMTSHVDTQERLEALRNCLRSIVQQNRFAQLMFSWSADSKVIDDVSKMLEATFPSKAERALHFFHPEPLSQFEALRDLNKRLQELSAEVLKGTGVPHTWLLFSDDDAIWHPRRLDFYCSGVEALARQAQGRGDGSEQQCSPSIEVLVAPWSVVASSADEGDDGGDRDGNAGEDTVPAAAPLASAALVPAAAPFVSAPVPAAAPFVSALDVKQRLANSRAFVQAAPPTAPPSASAEPGTASMGEAAPLPPPRAPPLPIGFWATMVRAELLSAFIDVAPTDLITSPSCSLAFGGFVGAHGIKATASCFHCNYDASTTPWLYAQSLRTSRLHASTGNSSGSHGKGKGCDDATAPPPVPVDVGDLPGGAGGHEEPSPLAASEDADYFRSLGASLRFSLPDEIGPRGFE